MVRANISRWVVNIAITCAANVQMSRANPFNTFVLQMSKWVMQTLFRHKLDVISPLQENFQWEIDSSTHLRAT